MSKLLERAKVSLANAHFNYSHGADDDSYVDMCCFNLQQCIEFTLKYIVEMHGYSYVENHDIRAQLNILRGAHVAIPRYDELRVMAATINSWETETRYNDNFVYLEEDISITFSLAQSLIDFAASLVTQSRVQSLSVFDES